MSYVLTIYSKEIYQDFILPAIDNADYTSAENIFTFR